MIRVETEGSVWLIDEARKMYCRLPKQEAPRKPEWGGPEAGPLQDAVWHDYEMWGVEDNPRREPRHNPSLTVILPGMGFISAPNATIIGTKDAP